MPNLRAKQRRILATWPIPGTGRRTTSTSRSKVMIEFTTVPNLRVLNTEAAVCVCVCLSVGFRLEPHIFLDLESLNLKPSTAALRQMLAQWRGGAHSRFFMPVWEHLVTLCLCHHMPKKTCWSSEAEPEAVLTPQAWPYWPSICRAVVCSSLWKQARIVFRNNSFRCYWTVRGGRMFMGIFRLLANLPLCVKTL